MARAQFAVRSRGSLALPVPSARPHGIKEFGQRPQFLKRELRRRQWPMLPQLPFASQRPAHRTQFTHQTKRRHRRSMAFVGARPCMAATRARTRQRNAEVERRSASAIDSHRSISAGSANASPTSHDGSRLGRHGDMTPGCVRTPSWRCARYPHRSQRPRRTRRSGPDRAHRHMRAHRRAMPSTFAACRCGARGDWRRG